MVQKEVQTPEAVSFFDKLKSVFGAVYPENAQETDEERLIAFETEQTACTGSRPCRLFLSQKKEHPAACFHNCENPAF